MIKVYGIPAPKGSLKCVGNRGGRNHQLVEDFRTNAKPWRAQITAAGKKALTKHGPLTGPLIVEVTFTVPRPASVPVSKRAWPENRSSGDGDKLMRMVLDGLDDADLYADDSQIVTGTYTKCYPDTPGAADRLDRPGAVIRIDQLQ